MIDVAQKNKERLKKIKLETEAKQKAKAEKQKLELLEDKMALCTGDLEHTYSPFITNKGFFFKSNLKNDESEGWPFVAERENWMDN